MPGTAIEGRLRRTWPQRLLIGANAVLVVVCLIAAGGLFYLNGKAARIQRVELGHVLSSEDAAEAGEPANFLLVGSDSAARLDPDDPVTIGRNMAGTLTDTVMVLRVDPDAEKLDLLSIPRDLWLPIAGTRSNQRINTALQTGGRDALIETVQSYFDISIHHYVEVDFQGFKDLVDAIGGVPVEVGEPARDRRSHLDVATAGCHVLDADQALAFARSRRFEFYEDGRWRQDQRSDLGRIERQQEFIRLAAERAIARGSRNPITLDRLIEAGLDNVTVDERLTPGDLAALGRRFRSFDPAELRTHTLPVRAGKAGQADVLRMVKDEAQLVLDVFRGVGADRVDSSSTPVKVLDGSRRRMGWEVAADLRAVGFDVTGVSETTSFAFALTTVQYAAARRAGAEQLARYLPVEAILMETPAVDGDVVLVIGSDLVGVLSEPKPSLQARPDATTDTTAVQPRGEQDWDSIEVGEPGESTPTIGPCS